MFNRGECSNHNDRFISQFHENLVQVTFEHFKKQNDSLKKRVDAKERQNNKIRKEIQACSAENKTLKKNLDKYNALKKSRDEDYERVRVLIENDVEELKSKNQEAMLRVDLREKKNRELEVETDNENNKLIAESHKYVIISDQLNLKSVKISHIEEEISNFKSLIQTIDQEHENKTKKLDTLGLHQKQVEKKYDASKEFVELINKMTEDFKVKMKLSDRANQSSYCYMDVHDKINAKLISIILRNSIPHDPDTLRQMMVGLDALNKDVSTARVKAASVVDCKEILSSSAQEEHSFVQKKTSKKSRRSKSWALSTGDGSGSKSTIIPGAGDRSGDFHPSSISHNIELLYRNMKSNDVSCSEN